MSWGIQIKKYAIVGAASAVTDFTITGLLIWYAGLSPEVTNLISRPCGGVVSFTGNKIWTFNRPTLDGTRRELTRFWIVWMVSYALSELLVWLFHIQFIRHSAIPLALSSGIERLTGIHLDMVKFLPKICAESIVCIGLFLSHRFWTFRQH